MLESCALISKLFYKLKDKLDTKITLKTHAVWKIPQIKDISVIKKWETGKSQMTRASYNKLKKCMS